MKFDRPGAEVFVPDGRDVDEALSRTTHMGIVAHPDDLEILAYRGILDCFGQAERSFSGVVLTDGAGSARSGPHAAVGDAQMRELRRAVAERAPSPPEDRGAGVRFSTP